MTNAMAETRDEVKLTEWEKFIVQFFFLWLGIMILSAVLCGMFQTEIRMLIHEKVFSKTCSTYDDKLRCE